MTLIKYKFDGYEEDKEFINGQEVDSPYLLIVLGFNGGFKIFYAYNELKKIEEKKEDFKKAKSISNKALQISINEFQIGIEKGKYENKKKEKNFTELRN